MWQHKGEIPFGLIIAIVFAIILGVIATVLVVTGKGGITQLGSEGINVLDAVLDVFG